MKNINTIKDGSILGKILVYTILILMCVAFIIPFWIIISSSFVSEAEAARRGMFILFPEKWDFSAYAMLLNNGSSIYTAYGVTLFVTIVGTALNLLVTVMLAYGLAKRDLPGVKFFSGMIFFTMLFGGGMIPSFLLNNYLGFMDSIFVMIIPSLVSAWNMFLMRNFFYGLPPSLEEAALIDGANPVTILFRVILPLSLPAMATIGLFYAVGHWNDWFTANIYINTISKMPVQNVMRRIVLNSDIKNLGDMAFSVSEQPPMAETIKSAAMVIGTLPIMLVYPFLQKYFIKGVTVGSVKG